MNMNIKDIVNRANGSSYTLEEMCYIIEQYIFIKKDRKITINPYKSSILNGKINSLYFQIELKKIIKAFNYALVFINR